jgi:hypothetical protein
MIKFLDAPDQLRGDHLWGGSEGGGNNPGDQPRVGGSPLNDAEHKDYLKFIGSEPLPTLKEQKDRAKIELRRLVIAHRDHFSKVPVDLEKNSSAKYEREHFVSDLRTNGTNNAWVKIGMAKLADGTDETTVSRPAAVPPRLHGADPERASAASPARVRSFWSLTRRSLLSLPVA